MTLLAQLFNSIYSLLFLQAFWAAHSDDTACVAFHFNLLSPFPAGVLGRPQWWQDTACIAFQFNLLSPFPAGVLGRPQGRPPHWAQQGAGRHLSTGTLAAGIAFLNSAWEWALHSRFCSIFPVYCL